MKKYFLFFIACLSTLMVAAEPAPIYLETFDRCIDADDENYGYTGGNDEQWGGDIAKAVVIYQDSPEWSFTYCNGAYQCLKVGTSQKQGSATTPLIACEGEVVLTFRVAPWEGDSIFYVSISGGQTTDQTMFHLKKHQWTEVTVHITDISSGIRVTFTSTNKHRFFLDDVCVRPADPNVGAIRTVEGTMLDFGLMGRYYSASSRTLHVEGLHLSNAGIAATLEEGETGLFQLSSTSLPAEGDELTVTLKSGAAEGTTHGCYLYLRGTDANTSAGVVKRITLMVEVASLDLEGSGTKPDPYTCSDVILLAANEGTVWTGTRYWATGYVIGGVKRYNDLFDGISLTDSLSLVLADSPDETDEDQFVTVQISGNARAALNVVENPELIGQLIKVEGLLLNDKANPLYLGLPGVRDVRTDAHYVRPPKSVTAIDNPPFPAGEGRGEATKILLNGQLYLMYNGTMYNTQGIRVK